MPFTSDPGAYSPSHLDPHPCGPVADCMAHWPLLGERPGLRENECDGEDYQQCKEHLCSSVVMWGTPGPWCRGGVGLACGCGHQRRMLCNREFCRCLGFPLKVGYGLFNQRRVVTLEDFLQRFIQCCW